MAEEAWKVLVRHRVEEAAGRCARAHGLLVDVLGDLAAPMLVADAPVWRARAQRAEDMLAGASGDLAVAASLMAATQLIALRGAAASPAAPLLSIDDVPDNEEDLRIALAQLQDARARAKDAYDSVEVCRAHLCAARQLLDYPHLPGVDSLLDVKRVSTRHDLDAARRFEQESTSRARTALLWLR